MSPSFGRLTGHPPSTFTTLNKVTLPYLTQEKLRFRDRLVWTVGLTVELNKPAFSNYSSLVWAWPQVIFRPDEFLSVWKQTCPSQVIKVHWFALRGSFCTALRIKLLPSLVENWHRWYFYLGRTKPFAGSVMGHRCEVNHDPCSLYFKVWTESIDAFSERKCRFKISQAFIL